ncbi:MAG: hypothetical protein ACPGJE_00485 [Wenzhouxiangellaceae bacterium]
MNPANEINTGNGQIEWWLSVAEITTSGIASAASVTERIHLEIANETFKILNRVPVVRQVSNVVQTTHHGIARLCYRSVGSGSMLLSRLCRADGRF